VLTLPLRPLHATQVDDDGNIIDSCFKTFGCGSAIASSSVATEWVKGRHIDGAASIKNSDIAKHLSLPPVKLHCSMLAEDAIKARARARVFARVRGGVQRAG
jgi:nitrogen fixation NifU-like protein